MRNTWKGCARTRCKIRECYRLVAINSSNNYHVKVIFACNLCHVLVDHNATSFEGLWTNLLVLTRNPESSFVKFDNLGLISRLKYTRKNFTGEEWQERAQLGQRGYPHHRFVPWVLKKNGQIREMDFDNCLCLKNIPGTPRQKRDLM